MRFILSGKKYEVDTFLILVLLLVSILFLTNLGNVYLWQDEALTASLGINVLKYGYPRIWDGKNWIFVPPVMQLDKYYVFQLLYWIQAYVTATSFLIMRPDTFYARLPFALFGLLSLVVYFFLVEGIFRNKVITYISLLLLGTSVQFILISRDSRYYSLGVFLSIWILYAYSRFIRTGKIKPFLVQFITATTLLFYTSISFFLGTIVSVVCHYLLYNLHDKKRILPFFTALLFIMAIVLPLFLYIPMSSNQQSFYVPAESMSNLVEYLIEINDYVFPLIIIIPAVVIYLKRVHEVSPETRAEIHMLGLFVVSSIIFTLPAYPFRFIRYLVVVFPFFYLISTVVIYELEKKSKILSYLLLATLLFTNLLSIPYSIVHPIMFETSHRDIMLKSYLLSYIYQITHDYDGPVEGIVKYLNEHGSEYDTVKTNYEELPLIFYTNMTIVPRVNFTDNIPADWIIYRKSIYWINTSEEYVKNITGCYDTISLDYPDIPWENRPDLDYHKFRTVEEAENKIILYHRNDSKCA